MVLQSPIYKAPSIPKMGKKSSPLSSSSEKIESAVKGPDLKTSKMSFIQGLGISIITAESLKSVEKPVISTNTLKIVEKIILKPEKLKESDRKVSGVEPEKLKGPDTSKVKGSSSINTDLIETNSILVEIQKQLELDFASRIAERKQNLASAKKKIRKKKLIEKEEFVERGKGLAGNIIAFGSKVLSPVKSIFDKILDFLAIVGTGIALNTAWEWLSDEENRKKLLGVLEFLGKNWKLITGILVGGFILDKLLKLYGIFNGIRKAIKFLRGRKPPKPRGGGTRGGGTNNKGPDGGCGPVTGKGGCLDQLSATSDTARNLAQTLFATAFAVNYFKRFIPNAAPVTAPLQQPAEQEVEKEQEQQQSAPPEIPAVKPKVTPLEEIRKKAIPVEVEEYVGPLLQKYFSDLTIFGKTRTQSIQTPMGQLIVEPTSKNIFTGDDTPKFRFISKEEQDFKAQQTEAMANNPWIKTFFGVQKGLDIASMVLSGKPMKGRSIFGAGSQRQNSISKFRRTYGKLLRSKKKSRTSKDDAEIEKRIDEAEKLVDTPDFQKVILEQTLGKKTTDDEFMNILDDLLSGPGRLVVGKGGGDKDVPGFSQGGLIPGMASMMDTIPALLAKGEFVINSMSTKLFKPFLFAINDNAGKMFQNFVQAIKQIKNNVIRDEEISKKESENFKKFGKLVQEMENREQEKKRKELKEKLRRGGGGTGGSVKTVTRKTPTKIQTYRRGIGNGSRSGSTSPSSSTTNNEGKITTVNITQPFLNLAGQQTPAEPEVQPEEKASSGITISTTDSSNSYIMNSYVNYGIEV